MSRENECIVVGNGTSVLDGENGKAIDEFGTVVRFNRFETQGFQHQAGSKTDIWFCGLEAQHTSWRLTLPLREVYAHSWVRREDRCPVLKSFKKHGIEAKKVDHAIRDEMSAYAGTKYTVWSTGALGVWTMLKHFEKVNVTGFDWWGRKEQHYFKTNANRGTMHRPEEEKKLFDRLVAERRVQFLASSRKLTIGMATRDDFDGVWMTIQAIRMYHPEVLPEVEFIILDTNQNSAHGEAVRNFTKWVKEPIQYIPLNDGGTAVRTKIFELARTPYVLCMDCHVLLESGSLRKLIDGMDAGWDEGCLLQGPMLADNMNVMASHMAEIWRGGMLGIWSVAWRCPCGTVFQSYKREDGDKHWLECQSLNVPHEQLINCPGCDRDLPNKIPWCGHESRLEALGFTLAHHGEPFDIPAHGLAFFACRKDSWLGFHQGFAQFGGEECYIHEKYRQAGKTTICLPFAKWLHRFGRPCGPPYPMSWESRIRNYLLGHLELNLDLEPVLQHFSQTLHKQIQVDWVDGKPTDIRILDL